MTGFRNLMTGAAGVAGGGYEVDNSVVLNDGDSQYLNKTFNTPSSASQFGYSFWVKLGSGYADGYIISADGSGNNDNLYFESDGKITIQEGGAARLTTTQVLRDFHAWYNVVVAYDLGNGTNNLKLRLYINGSEVTDFDTDTRSSLSGTSSRLNANGISHDIGANVNNGVSTHVNPFDGYLAEFVFLDGTVITPSNVGEFDSNGIWRPISIEDASLTFGNNGFYLPFTTAAGLGQDYSGSTAEAKVQENTYNAGSEVNNGDMSGSAAGFVYTAVATAKLATVKINSSSRGFTNVTVQVQTDNGSNAPDGTTLTNGEVTGITGSGTGLKTVDFPNGGPELTAGTKYWIVIPSTDLGSGFEWGIQHDVSGSGGALGIIDSTGYQAGRGFGHEVYQLGNIWAPGNSPTQTTDTCTNNFCVWSEAFPKRSGNWTLSEGNRKATYSSSTDCGCPGSIGVSGAGTWYFEITASSSYTLAGIVSSAAVSSGDLASSTPGNGFSDLGGVAYGYYANNGYKLGGPSNVHASYGATFANTDVIGVAFDAANGTLTFYKNGSTQGQAFTGISTSETWFPFVHTWTNEPGVLLNNGQTAFAHTPPTGYVGINTTNLLAASAPAIEDGSAHFQATTYSGNGGSNEINQSGNSTFQPSLVWLKETDGGNHGTLIDAVRGGNKGLYPSLNFAEYDESNLSFDADGFSLSATGSAAQINGSSNNYIAWQWKGGDSNTAVSESGTGDDAIAACTHRANQTAGFSVVTYQGKNDEISNGQHTKVAHGLGKKPDLIIGKNLANGKDWFVMSIPQQNDAHMHLNTDAQNVGSDFTGTWSDSDTTHFVVGNDDLVNEAGADFVAYVFVEIPGYSKFGTFTGNGATDGPFISLGFKPAFILARPMGTASDWSIFDNGRSPVNVMNASLAPNTNAADYTHSSAKMDFLSNGVKMRGSFGPINTNNQEHLFMAFAEHPFAGTTPATAR